MFKREDVRNLPGNRIKFETVEDAKLELLVYRRNSIGDPWFSVCQDVLEILENIFENPPDLTCFGDLFISYSFSTINNRCIFDLSLDE